MLKDVFFEAGAAIGLAGKGALSYLGDRLAVASNEISDIGRSFRNAVRNEPTPAVHPSAAYAAAEKNRKPFAPSPLDI